VGMITSLLPFTTSVALLDRLQIAVDPLAGRPTCPYRFNLAAKPVVHLEIGAPPDEDACASGLLSCRLAARNGLRDASQRCSGGSNRRPEDPLCYLGQRPISLAARGPVPTRITCGRDWAPEA